MGITETSLPDKDLEDALEIVSSNILGVEEKLAEGQGNNQDQNNRGQALGELYQQKDALLQKIYEG
jgi:hypothetical protein